MEFVCNASCNLRATQTEVRCKQDCTLPGSGESPRIQEVARSRSGCTFSPGGLGEGSVSGPALGRDSRRVDKRELRYPEKGGAEPLLDYYAFFERLLKLSLR